MMSTRYVRLVEELESLKAKVKELYKELEDAKTGASEEAHFADRLQEQLRATQQMFEDECDNHEETKVILRQLKATLYKIKKIDEENYDCDEYNVYHSKLREILAKHEGKE